MKAPTVRFSVTDADSRLHRLWHAQGGVCSLCGHDMPHPSWSSDKFETPNIDHTWPKHLRLEDAVILSYQRRRRGRGTSGNSTAAHARCNVAKSNRMPTACELLWLMAVNARLGEVLREW